MLAEPTTKRFEVNEAGIVANIFVDFPCFSGYQKLFDGLCPVIGQPSGEAMNSPTGSGCPSTPPAAAPAVPMVPETIPV